MTISDFIARLTRVQKELGNTGRQSVKIGKDYNEIKNCFDAFDIRVVDNEIILVPSDIWIAKREVTIRPVLHDFYQG